MPANTRDLLDEMAAEGQALGMYHSPSIQQQLAVYLKAHPEAILPGTVFIDPQGIDTVWRFHHRFYTEWHYFTTEDEMDCGRGVVFERLEDGDSSLLRALDNGPDLLDKATTGAMFLDLPNGSVWFDDHPRIKSWCAMYNGCMSTIEESTRENAIASAWMAFKGC